MKNTTKKCKFCQTDIPAKAKVCPNCKRTLKSHGCLTFLIAFLIVCAFIGVIIAFIDKNGVSTKPDISKFLDVTNEQSEKINAILTDCGISKLKTVEHDPALDNAHMENETGYRLTANGIDNIILYLDSNNAVYALRYADYDLYADNAVVASILDYCFTTKEMSDLQIKCEAKVKEVLKSPTTAKFPNILEWKFGKNRNIVTIQSYVNSQNGFGATIQSDFQFIIDTDTNTIQSFIFDGQEMITSNE